MNGPPAASKWKLEVFRSRRAYLRTLPAAFCVLHFYLHVWHSRQTSSLIVNSGTVVYCPHWTLINRNRWRELLFLPSPHPSLRTSRLAIRGAARSRIPICINLYYNLWAWLGIENCWRAGKGWKTFSYLIFAQKAGKFLEGYYIILRATQRNYEQWIMARYDISEWSAL